MMEGPIICMIWEGKDVIAQGRKIVGATNPLQADIGTLRGDFCLDTGRNLIHGSDSKESAEREITLWFRDVEVFDWARHDKWLYE